MIEHALADGLVALRPFPCLKPIHAKVIGLVLIFYAISKHIHLIPIEPLFDPSAHKCLTPLDTCGTTTAMKLAQLSQ
jgi:hypothetical protein